MSIFRRIINKLQGVNFQTLKYCTTIENQAKVEDFTPIISKIQYDDEDNLYQKPREVWLENLDTVQEKKLGLITLHPHIYAAAPRIDIIFENVRWQRMYRWVVSDTELILYCKVLLMYFMHLLSSIYIICRVMRIRKRVLKSEVVAESLGNKRDWDELDMEVYARHYGEAAE